MLTKSEIYSYASRTDPKARLLSRYLESPVGCWEYTAGLDRGGYGRFAVGPRRLGAHKVSYVLHVGDVPSGMVVMHKCDNPKCINPDHLSLGTPKDNVRDCIQKGRFVFADTEDFVQKVRNKARRGYAPNMYVAHNDEEMLVFTDIQAVREAGFTGPNVSRCCNGKRDKYAGYRWYIVER